MRLTAPLIVVLALALAGCETGQSASPLTPPPAPRADSGAPLPADYPPLPEGLPAARVTRVVDGDTIVVELDGREERVRMLGINTPESVDPRRPVQCFGKEASANAKAMLAGLNVLLEGDPSQGSRDQNGRLLRYVWLEDGRMANLEQLALGFAAEYTYEQPYRYREVFRAAQDAARKAQLGLWSPSTCGGRFDPVGEVGSSAAGGPAPTPSERGQGADAARCPEPPDPTSAPNAPVRIVGLDKEGEAIQLANVGAAAVSLDGWLLCSVRGGERQAGLSGALAPGETRELANPDEPIWSNGQRDDAALYDPGGALISYWEDR